MLCFGTKPWKENVFKSQQKIALVRNTLASDHKGCHLDSPPVILVAFLVAMCPQSVLLYLYMYLWLYLLLFSFTMPIFCLSSIIAAKHKHFKTSWRRWYKRMFQTNQTYKYASQCSSEVEPRSSSNTKEIWVTHPRCNWLQLNWVPPWQKCIIRIHDGQKAIWVPILATVQYWAPPCLHPNTRPQLGHCPNVDDRNQCHSSGLQPTKGVSCLQKHKCI